MLSRVEGGRIVKEACCEDFTRIPSTFITIYLLVHTMINGFISSREECQGTNIMFSLERENLESVINNFLPPL